MALEVGSERRVLNILQMDVSSRYSPVRQICTFSNLSGGPVQGLNCEVFSESVLIEQQGTQMWKCYVSCAPCHCRTSYLTHFIVLQPVCYGKGVVLELTKDEYYGLMFHSHKSMASQKDIKIYSGKTMVIKMDGYALSLFLSYLKRSPKYVELVTNYLSDLLEDTRRFVLQLGAMAIFTNRFRIGIQEPDGHVLDLAWARRACKTVNDIRQLQSNMSWLSTLGGAFSALGEEQEKCAVAAGWISIEQLNLALQMGDKIVVAQCKLFFSLSLIQRGYTSRARVIIYEQFMNQKNSHFPDVKTMNMCKGIWSRLKHAINQRRALKGKPVAGAGVSREGKLVGTGGAVTLVKP